MKVLVFGATGTIGRAVVRVLTGRHTVIPVGHSRGDQRVDLADAGTIREIYQAAGRVDAVVCAAGQAAFRPLAELRDEDFALSLANKLMGQVNLVRLGIAHLADGGSFTLTSGTLAQTPMAGGAAISLVNAGLEGFVRAAAIELPRGLRVNAVSPGWVRETLESLGQHPDGGTPAILVAQAYVRSLEGNMTGQVLNP
jgi:NAD(P)-dependent dehydrogenase (short-subunit alcohol dehydrogenase family)